MRIKMKIYAILLIIGMIFSIGCARKINTIPQITSNLYQDDLLDLTGKPIVKKIIKNNTGIVMVSVDGNVMHLDTAKRTTQTQFSLNRVLEADVFAQGQYMVLKEKIPADAQTASPVYTILDCNEMKPIAEFKDNGIEKVTGVDSTHIVYLSTGPKRLLTIMDYSSVKILKTFETKEQEILFNSEFKGNKIYILSSLNLYTYDIATNTIKTTALPVPSASDFLLDNNQVYYGSNRMELVRMDLNSGKAHWKFKLADFLAAPPNKIGSYIAVIPKDNNVCFFNKNGTLYWWEKLGSIISEPPVVMKENIAVCLWNGNIKFLNPFSKKAFAFSLNRLFKTNPVSIGDYAFVVSEEKESSLNASKENKTDDSDNTDELDDTEDTPPRFISKVGNFYGVKLVTTPGQGYSVNKSIQFKMGSVNLIEPRFTIQIFNPSSPDKAVFQRVLDPKKELPEIIWVPTSDADYRLVIQIDSKNKKGLFQEEILKVTDYNRIIQDYYFKIQTGCDHDLFNKRSK